MLDVKNVQIMNFENLRLSLFQNSQAVNSKAVTIQEIIRLIKFDDTVRDKQALYDDLDARVTEKYAKEKVKDASMPIFSGLLCSASSVSNGATPTVATLIV
jgi:hypothetical protein